MQYLPDERNQEREHLIQRWRSAERTAFRSAGLALIFGAALVIVLEQPGDNLTAVVSAAMIAGGFTLIFQSRVQRKHASIHFANRQQQATRASIAGAAALFLLIQSVRSSRPLFMVGAGMLGAAALWYRWREQMLIRFDGLFPERKEVFGDESTE